ncbi:DUF5681 domain-containing protein [Paludibacterium sp.]|uniref:DUF5681 domain-containing protein n=1 Tax=Paludibacterium sp. TaxID=1917523 RepID=UPI0025F9A02F|nr:DUF5681 domain-containing protein [Paludibacterium sp.]MBV8647857.1 hypothetical protein [Paludibacterium sp.]
MSEDNQKPYDVGYKKPPKHTRYKPGKSGNPRGRPKQGQRSIIGLFYDDLQKMMQLSEGGKEVKLSKGEGFVKRVINGAISGNDRSIAAMIKLIPLLEEMHRNHMMFEAMSRVEEAKRFLRDDD